VLNNKRPTTIKVKNDMETEIQIVPGPSSTRLTKEAAAEGLVKMPGFPKGASYTLKDVDGRWFAAVVVPKELTKESAPFPPGGDGPPSGPPTGGPDEESGPPSEDGPPTDEGEDKPKGDDDKSSEGAPKEDGKLSLEHQLANLTDMLTKITDALGLSSPADGMVPGPDDGAVPPPDGPPGLGGGEDGVPKPGEGPDGKTHTVHERSLKPNEAPPGTTPVGAPAFGSVQEDHPWKAAIEAGVKEFEVESAIGDQPIATVAHELKTLAAPYGYVVTDLAPSGGGNSRTASARIVRTR
jgi:hypothetical protein